MYEGNNATIQMKKLLIEDANLDEKSYPCKVVSFEKQSEYISLLLLENQLNEILLDAVYECRIITEEAGISCEGTIRERYQSENGNILVFHIDAGFYEINIK